MSEKILIIATLSFVFFLAIKYDEEHYGRKEIKEEKQSIKPAIYLAGANVALGGISLYVHNKFKNKLNRNIINEL